MQLASDLRIKTSHYILTGFSLVTALSWNENIKILINKVFPLESDALVMRFIYSIIITMALIVFIKYMPSTDKELPPVVKKELYTRYNDKKLL